MAWFEHNFTQEDMNWFTFETFFMDGKLRVDYEADIHLNKWMQSNVQTYFSQIRVTPQSY